MVDDLGRPIVNLLPEAEVAGTPTQYKDRDLASAVLRGGALAGREALGMVPFVGEALDVAELSQITRTGKDFYGDEVNPAMYAGMTAAGMLLPNIIERPARALGKAFVKTGKRFANIGGSKIDWGAWNPEIPKNKDLLKEYNEIEKRTKRDGTWMKSLDGTDFDGPPELFVQMQSRAFKKAFPDGYDKLYRGVAVNDDKGLTPTSKGRDLEGEPQFFSEDRSQAEQYTKSIDEADETVGADYADRSSGVYEMAYPPNTPRIDLDTRGSGFSNIELFSEKTVPELESQASELKEILKTSKDPAVRSNASYNLDFIQDVLKYIKENPTPRKVSSDAEVKEFIKRYRDWVDKSGKAAIPGGMLTDDITMFMEDNPDLYDRIVLRGLDDESIGDVNIINAGKAPFPKSLKGNVGTFDLNDPNVFKALLPIVGAAAAVRASRGQGEKNSNAQGGMITMKRRATGMSPIQK